MLAEPTLVTLDGREALFEVTGHTKLEVLPIVMGNGRVRLEYRIDLSSPQSEPARSSYKREPPPAVTTVRLNSATNLDLGKLCVVGQMKTNVPAANGKTQEIETLVLARVDLVKPDSPVKTAAAPEGVPAAAATR